MDIQEEAMKIAASRVAETPALRGTKDSGRYANRVCVKAPQGSHYDGQHGVVTRVEGDTVFVRFHGAVVLPFGRGEVEVIS